MASLLQLNVPLILASQSPRRRQLLEQIDLSFSVQVSPADETTDQDLTPKALARTFARKKAAPVAETHPQSLILSADTVVIHENRVLGKPSSPSDAEQMLRTLSNHSHEVYTGICLEHAGSNRVVTVGQTTTVTFADLTENEIEAYASTGSPMDKAGGYGIQDHTAPFLIERLEGDYYNVVGLPLRLVYTTLIDEFEDLLNTQR